ncbi:PREDICTED: protein ENHANCED DOWNY MILDEW 2-like isoform X2 [Lupinus angustifolius]|uniref:protein ENHANCED DOWNY MILDEW 2-like isoform X2 n=1 Tax=Lupinus angustifolius TaxID=3871 RepID=UPI00092EC207|nr:PREDICTED: protein ENHANCED DOWNY MILDEW 2-like isoform X2 [Lupinus angustifolius]
MASSDEEGEIVPDFVNDYWFENDKGGLVSFSSLTLLWGISDIKCDLETKVFLRGTTDDGLQKIYKQIIGWRFELPHGQPEPEISVLLKDKNWITLQKPRKCFESTIRTVLVAVYWLHFVKWNREEATISVWNKVLTTFGSFEVAPSENDVLNHMSLISEAANRDKDLAKSKCLLRLIQKSSSNEGFHEDIHTAKTSKFIVDSEEEEIDESDSELNAEVEQNIGYDTVCAICDNGGEILPCEGPCLRSFHATKEDGKDSLCESLGYSITQVNAIPNFYCKNCRYKQHQCFVCGKLGSSDVSSNAEVFPCITANCGQYYHPECVARLISPGTEQEEMKKRVASGKSFLCPLHMCFLCRKGENRNVQDLQFAICRRCPKAYHRKCLPKEISFTYDYDKGIELRAWDGLLDHRILMYCMDHELIRGLGTPARHHLAFPDMEVKRKICSYNLLDKAKGAKTLTQSFESLPPKRTLVPNQVTKESVSNQSGGHSKVMEKISFKKDKCLSTGSFQIDMTRKLSKDEKIFVSNKSLPSAKNKFSSRNDNLSNSSRLFNARSQQQKNVSQRIEKACLEKPLVKKLKNSLNFDNADMEKRILSLMKETTSTFNEEESKKNCFADTVFNKNLTQGKVEGSVKAIQTALQRLEEGCSIEDARAICEPGILSQLFMWKKQLKVFLAPFLYGMRYTSFGRHFTKIDKLKEILDFCCGSNDFSCLMKSKLEQMGKSCSFKNYDLFQAKNDFNFEKRDWMSVNAEELPNGNHLIIGLNPPFGVKGSLANKFIDKALTFKPKLLILIVPKVTKRLDRKKGGGYDLIWEDDKMLSGKSFYLPGSVDTREKQLEDWNVDPPPLYLWSRPDWTAWHRKIAQKYSHIRENYDVHGKGKDIKNYLMEENHDCYQNYLGLHEPDDFSSIFDGVPDDSVDIAHLVGQTSNISSQLKETVFPYCGREIDCEDQLLPDEDGK